MRNWKLWLKGLAAAAIGGVATTGTTYKGSWAQGAATGQHVPITGGTIGGVAISGAIIGALGYLWKSPRQFDQGERK